MQIWSERHYVCDNTATVIATILNFIKAAQENNKLNAIVANDTKSVPFEYREVGRIRKLTNDRSKFNFTFRYLPLSVQKFRNQIMQPMPLLSTTCINLRRLIVDLSKGWRKADNTISRWLLNELSSCGKKGYLDDTYQIIVTNCIWRLHFDSSPLRNSKLFYSLKRKRYFKFPLKKYLAGITLMVSFEIR